MALLPAVVCGYLSLSERGALAALWYPAVVWMLVILDGPASSRAPGILETVPVVAGLGVLCMAYLRAVETRRAALWQAHASGPLAEARSVIVLRASPFRSASHLGWSALVSIATLALVAWIAPHLWHKEASKHAPPIVAPKVARDGHGGGAVCCAETPIEEPKRERVTDYFPPLHSESVVAPPPVRPACVPCNDAKTLASDGYGNGGWTGSGNAVAPSSTESSTYPEAPSTAVTYGGGYGGGPVYPDAPSPYPGAGAAATQPWQQPPYAATPLDVMPSGAMTPPLTTPKPLPAAPPPVVADEPVMAPPLQIVPVPATAPASVDVATASIPKPLAPQGSDDRWPWRTLAAIAFGALGLHALGRALRRKLTLRHLARPFWRETVDQRISNYWQLAMIGLGDAGYQTAPGEQPQALARRIGIESLTTCATILDRVRHGVRVEDEDLATMETASQDAYRAARKRAGVAGRAIASFRWPLA
jgi:hypothetical protein